MSRLQKGFIKDSSRWTSFQTRINTEEELDHPWQSLHPGPPSVSSSSQSSLPLQYQVSATQALDLTPIRGRASSSATFSRPYVTSPMSSTAASKLTGFSVKRGRGLSPDTERPQVASTLALSESSNPFQNQSKKSFVSSLPNCSFLNVQLGRQGPKLTSTPRPHQERKIFHSASASTILGAPEHASKKEDWGSISLNSSFVSNSRFNMSEINTTCYVAVMEGRGNARGEIGIASISLNCPTLVLCQFSDTSTYARTLMKLSVFQPAKVLLPKTPHGNEAEEYKLHREIRELRSVGEIIPVHRKYFDDSQGLQLVKDLCAPQFSSVELQLGHKFYALAAAHSLLKYVEYIEHVVFAPKTVKVEFQSSTNSVMIDVETAKHIELVYPNFNIKSTNSLFGFLNHCSTPGGSRFLRSCIFQPTIQIEIIEIRLEAIEELLSRTEVLSGLSSVLSRFTDLDQLLALCVFIKKDEQQQSVIAKMIDRMICLKNALELISPLLTVLATGVQSKYLAATSESLQNPTYQKILTRLKKVFHDEATPVSSSATMRLQRCFAVSPKVDGLLDVARQTYCEIIEDMERHVSRLSEVHGLPLRLAFNAQKGYHIQLTTNKSLQLNIHDLPPGFLRPHKLRSMFTFVTNEIIHLDQRSQETMKEINVITNTVLSQVLAELRDDIGCLYNLSEAISSLDMIISLAQVGSLPGFVKPTFGDLLDVRDSRHPILVHMAHNFSKAGRFHKTSPIETTLEVVPNDIVATKEFSFHILTGVNMSGKSTYLKQIILLQIMAQIGCYVPASSAKFRVADSIFARIGTGDNLECNASTFSVECKEMSYIMNNMTTDSLIVIDEFGRSTSNHEAMALCWAVAEKIISSKAFAFFATHFQILCNLEKLHSQVKNFFFTSNNMVGDDGERFGSHRLVKGRMSVQCYGLDFARSISYPQDSLEKAEVISKSLENEMQFTWQDDEDQIESLNVRKLVYRLKSLALKSPDDVKEELARLQHLFKEPEDSED